MFKTNDKVKVIDIVNVRHTPGHLSKASNDVFTQIQPGQTVLVVSGPHSVDGLDWYELALGGQQGFVAEAVNGITLLSVDPGATPPVVPPAPVSSPLATAANAAIPGAQYGKLSINGNPTDRPAAEHGDINLQLRGFTLTQSTRALIDMNGPTDAHAPQLTGIFANERQAQVSNVYRSYEWDWGSNARGGPLPEYDVHVLGLPSQPGETVHAPSAGYELGDGYQALVLYASPERLTLKYTREDNVINGYTLHIDNVHAEPSLLALYEQMNAQGRHELPAVRAGQALGRARGDEVQVAIRDTGRFMDPRVRKDWWHG